MATRDSIVQVPFIGGVDEGADPDQLQAPAMKSLVNVTTRKIGRIEKRAGFEFLAQTGSTAVPATTFGGASAVLPSDVEAVGSHTGQEGTTTLVAAGNKLFEYVGLDAAHGFREVNKLPSCYGTLHPVDASGGAVTEVESMLNDTGTLRCTAWVMGNITNHDMTDDTAVSNQSTLSQGIFVSVQRVSDGSFVTPAVRLKNVYGDLAVGVSDLRMCRTTKGDGVMVWLVAFRSEYTSIQLAVVDGGTGAFVCPVQSIYIDPLWVLQSTHRSFDITSVPGQPSFLAAWCAPNNPAASTGVNLRMYNIDYLGAFAIVNPPIADVLQSVNAIGSAGAFYWSKYAARGVVLETDPSDINNIGIAIRTVHYTAGATPIIDGKIVVTRVSAAGGVLAVGALDWAWVHQVGFQTKENFAASVPSVAFGSFCRAATGQFNIAVPGVYGLSIILSGMFLDGSVQTYKAQIAASNLVLGQALPATGDAVRIISSYYPVLSSAVGNSGAYPGVSHAYYGNNYVDIQTPTLSAAGVAGESNISYTAITRIVATPIDAFLPFANSVQNVRFNNGAFTLAYAVVAFDSLGKPTQAELYNGINTYVVAGAPGAHNATSFDVGPTYLGPWAGAYPVPTPGTFVFYDDLNTAAPGFYTPVVDVGRDFGSDLGAISQTSVDAMRLPEVCVHRWDIKRLGNGRFVLAISSVSAGIYKDPNGAEPLGYASPLAQNNFFEVYEWSLAPQLNLNDYNGGSSQNLWCALGGPWRMASSIAYTNSRLHCILSPAGDPLQKSMMLVSMSRPSVLVTGARSGKLPSQGGGTILVASNYSYIGNAGVFVESVNMARVMGTPLNCPRLRVASDGGMSVGAIRAGSSGGQQEVFATDYTFGAARWRAVKEWCDYTMVNGGVVSSFDGAGCTEATPFLWPQGDMCSIGYDAAASKRYSSSGNARLNYAFANVSVVPAKYAPLLGEITRPWLAYEAGFVTRNGTGAGTPTGVTAWGGSALDDWQSVYQDPRTGLTQGRSAAVYGGASGSENELHYYGRYQTGSQARYIRLDPAWDVAILWAPRATLTDVSEVYNAPIPYATIESGSKYTPMVSNGDFLARWCYESTDGTGRVMRSAPSRATTFSIFAYLTAKFKNSPSGLASAPGATNNGAIVNEYRYGFFVPGIELTNNSTISSVGARKMVLRPYFTAEPFATVFYSAPVTNFPGYEDRFTINMNSTRGVVGAPIVTNNFKCFDGPQGDYNGILSQPYLYTTGGVLDNVCPPSALCMCIHQNRLVLGGADDTTVVWFSKELSPTDAPGFNDALTLQIEEGGAVTGLASFNGLLFVFKRRTAFVVAGDMPDDTGGGIGRGNGSISSLATPVRMAHDVGCINHRSVVETPIGIFFQSERTLELLDQNMSITPVGFALEETMATFPEVTNAIHHPKDNEVWFTVHTVGATEAAGEQFRVLVFNYSTKQWSTSKFGAIGTGRVQLGLVDNRPCLAATGAASGVVYRQTPSKFFDVAPTGRQYVAMSGTTAPVALNQIQGYERVKRLRVFGNPVPSLSTGAAQTREPHGFSMMLQSDFKNTGVFSGSQTATWTQSESLAVWTDQSREVYEVHLANQKCQQVVLSFAETAPSDITTLTHGYGTSLSNMALVVGLKSGLDKKITSDAKH